MSAWLAAALLSVAVASVLAFLLYRCSALPLRERLEASNALRLPPPTSEKSPALFDDAQLDLSVVVPAYNEETRLASMLDECLAFLRTRSATFEILVLDDGSVDATVQTALDWGKKHLDQSENVLRVISLSRNAGKGAAVTQGVLHAHGQLILFADADGASRFSDLALLEQELEELQAKTSYAIAAGSRAHMVNTAAVVQRSLVRNALMRAFHLYLEMLGVGHVKDTQCGFKLFTREAARLIFPNMHIAGWVFDIEILLLAEMQAIPVKEVPITWCEVDGSKMRIARDAVIMAIDLLSIRLNYLVGRWRLTTKM